MYFSDKVLVDYKRIRNAEDKIMCQTLKKIMGKSPEELLSITGQENSIPVDVSTILHHLQISEIKMNFSQIEQALNLDDAKKGTISGMVLLSEDNVGIFFNEEDTLNRQRFTIAHELAHCCLDGEELMKNHIEFRFDIDSDDASEVAANTFAGKLLVPEKSLKKVYEQLSIPVVESLAKIFQVSQAVMKERLKMLHMDYFDTELNEMVILEEE